MKILVTGSEGSLMQWVIPRLLKEGHEVVGADNFSRYGEVKKERAYEFHKCDLTNKQTVKDLCKDVEGIIQAAAQIYGVKGFHKYPADILSRDIELHSNLLWEAKKQEMKRMVYISSSMVYERVEQVPVKEKDTDNMRIPLTDYGLSKFVGERLTKAFKKQYDLDYTIWRPFNIITPYERGEEEPGVSHVFADFIRRMVYEKQNPMTILGDGNQVRCFTWIDDVARGIAEKSFSVEAKNETFNLGNPEDVSMKELAYRILKELKRRGEKSESEILLFNHLPIYKDDVRIRIPSVEKAKNILGWEPTIKLDEALGICIDEALKK